MNRTSAVLLLSLLLLSACGRGHYGDSLDTADSLLSADPDSALSLLRAISDSIDSKPTSVQMRHTMLLADAMNKTFSPMDSASGILPKLHRVVDYYDSHGSANDRIRAYYLLGSAYRDNGETPEALQYYHDAADCADTTANCDYRLLARVYGQMAELFENQSMYDYSLSYNRLAEQTAWIAKDTLAALAMMGRTAVSYDEQNNGDSVIALSERASKLFLEFGDTITANTSLGPAIYMYIIRDSLSIAKDYIDRYEYHSDFSEEAASKSPSYYVFYYQKGLYYLKTQQYDSAYHYFHKELASTDDPNNVMLANDGLYELFKAIGQKDSAMRYADDFRGKVNSIITSNIFSSLQNIQLLYNYTRHQQEAQKERLRAGKMEAVLWRFVFFFMLAAIGIGLGVHYLHRRHKRQIQILITDYSDNLQAYNELKERLKEAKEMHEGDDALIASLTQQLEATKQFIAGTQADKASPDAWDLEDALLSSDIVMRFHAKASCGQQVNDSEWQRLRQAINNHLPRFVSKLQECSAALDLIDTQICYLIKLRFLPGEMCSLMNMKPSAMTNRRRRLHEKITGKNGSTEETDAFIKSL